MCRLEREKQREFLDRYYEEQLREQIATLEDRISSQTKQFKQYVTDIQTSHGDEVEALRSQLSELQQNFRLTDDDNDAFLGNHKELFEHLFEFLKYLEASIEFLYSDENDL